MRCPARRRVVAIDGKASGRRDAKRSSRSAPPLFPPSASRPNALRSIQDGTPSAYRQKRCSAIVDGGISSTRTGDATWWLGAAGKLTGDPPAVCCARRPDGCRPLVCARGSDAGCYIPPGSAGLARDSSGVLYDQSLLSRAFLPAFVQDNAVVTVQPFSQIHGRCSDQPFLLNSTKRRRDSTPCQKNRYPNQSASLQNSP